MQIQTQEENQKERTYIENLKNLQDLADLQDQNTILAEGQQNLALAEDQVVEIKAVLLKQEAAEVLDQTIVRQPEAAKVAEVMKAVEVLIVVEATIVEEAVTLEAADLQEDIHPVVVLQVALLAGLQDQVLQAVAQEATVEEEVANSPQLNQTNFIVYSN